MWEDNIKIILREIGLGAMDMIHVSEGRDQKQSLVNIVMNLRVL
jgi:hypothetical protein